MPASIRSSLSPDITRRLEPLTHAYRFLPIGKGSEGKAPMVKDWPNFPGASIEQLNRWPGIKAIGVITGPSLLCFDFDGHTAVMRGIEQGLCADDTNTWRINRDNDRNRFKLIFRPTAEQLAQLPNKQITCKEHTKDKVVGDDGKVIAKGEAIEVFMHPGRQVIVAGDHPSTGGVYLWPEGKGPERLLPPPGFWWDYVLKQARDYPNPAAGAHRTVSTGRGRNGDWRRLDRETCPVCGRGPNDNPACQLHRDGQTLRCFVGSTFSPPLGLAPGQLAPGTEWAYSSLSPTDWGDFLVFVKDKPSPLQMLHNWVNSRDY